MLPGELKWMLRQPTVGNELTGAKKVLLMVVIPRESNEFLPTCKLTTYELLAAAILLFLHPLLNICRLGILLIFKREFSLVYYRAANQDCWTIVIGAVKRTPGSSRSRWLLWALHFVCWRDVRFSRLLGPIVWVLPLVLQLLWLV